MAQYTMELREIINDLDINIFNFEYELDKSLSKEYFEKMFIKHFYFREIGTETVERFIFSLDERLNLLLPTYNKLFMSQNLEQRILDNYDVTEKFERELKSTGNTTNESNNKNLFSDTPKKRIDISTNDYVTNISKDSGTSTSNSVGDNKENWVRTMQGNIGIQTDADAIEKYEKVVRNVLKELFNDLETLFMQVY